VDKGDGAPEHASQIVRQPAAGGVSMVLRERVAGDEVEQ
jgi:hypothetical protein